jgi:hypothetical protein
VKKILSYSFFRHEASAYESERCGVARGIFFVNYLQALVRAHHYSWPGWELWIHHDDRAKEFAYFGCLMSMAVSGLLRLIDCGKAETLCGSMLWRMKPVWDLEAGWVVCRDVDSLPMPRDRVMVEEADKADAVVHAVLDSESHSGPLMGGMVAFRAPRLRTALPYYKTWDDFMLRAKFHGIDMNKHGADQRLLNLEIWPALRDHTLIHQRRQDIQYPEAMETRPVAPKVDRLDDFVHMGGAYNVEKVMPFFKDNPSTTNTLIEACEV